MTYALIQDGAVIEYPVYAGDIMLRFPNTSFPVPFEPPAGYEPVLDTPPPSVDYRKNVTTGTPVLLGDGWTRQWVVSDATAEQIQDRVNVKSEEVRSIRDSLLSDCDWTQLRDAPGNQAVWAAYRQELRDLTKQPGFPWQVDWPTPPTEKSAPVPS